jgi:hypothetical protein
MIAVMKKTLSSVYALMCYAIGFLSLLYWIASTGNLLPNASIDGPPRINTYLAILKNAGLVLLFGIQHSVMARKRFKAVDNQVYTNSHSNAALMFWLQVLYLTCWFGNGNPSVELSGKSATIQYGILFFMDCFSPVGEFFLLPHF